MYSSTPSPLKSVWPVLILATWPLSTLSTTHGQEDSADQSTPPSIFSRSDADLRELIEELGMGNIIVRTVHPTPEDGFDDSIPFGLTRNDLNRLNSTVPTIQKSSRFRELTTQAIYPGDSGSEPQESLMIGCTPEYLEMNQLEMERGRFLKARDIELSSSVCVLSKTLADDLFRDVDPFHRMIYLPEQKIYLQVVGVVKTRDSRAGIGDAFPARNFSREIYFPLTTMRARMGDTVTTRSDGRFKVDHYELSQATFKVSDIDDVESTADLIEATLKQHHAERTDIAIIVPLRILKRAMAIRACTLDLATAARSLGSEAAE